MLNRCRWENHDLEGHAGMTSRVIDRLQRQANDAAI
jgi:hypothetical protein